MEQLSNFGDERNQGFCIHCGGPDESNDHIPSKVLLDEPFPENMHVCACCLRCNNGLSADEEYLACLLECVLAGSAEPSIIQRAKIGRLLAAKPPLLARLQKARSSETSPPVWNVENDRVRRVVLKLARGHVAYELNEPQLEDPDDLDYRPLSILTDKERDEFEAATANVLAPWPEVGSRSLQRMLVVGSEAYDAGWIDVQEGNYRYLVSPIGGTTVKIVVREYLACEVHWS
jgi:hypothetical protein